MFFFRQQAQPHESFIFSHPKVLCTDSASNSAARREIEEPPSYPFTRTTQGAVASQSNNGQKQNLRNPLVHGNSDHGVLSDCRRSEKIARADSCVLIVGSPIHRFPYSYDAQ